MEITGLKSDEIELIYSQSTKWNVTIDNSSLEKLGAYISLLKSYSIKFGLVSKGDLNRLFEYHIIDSLEVLRIIKERNNKRVIDAGSGAGLPGIPLSIICPELNITLIERSSRKSEFLALVKRKLNLSNIKIINISVEELTDFYDFILFRAVKSFNECRKLADPIISKGAIMIYYNIRHGDVHERFITYP